MEWLRWFGSLGCLEGGDVTLKENWDFLVAVMSVCLLRF